VIYNRFLLGILAVMIFSVTIHVPGDYVRIQGAMDAAVNGDRVLVKPGTYVENIEFLGKAITLSSELGPVATVIDGIQLTNVVKCCSYEDKKTILDGFTITNGTGVTYPAHAGGWMCTNSSSPTVINCVFTENRLAVEGGQSGGMYNSFCDSIITNCKFEGNSAHLYGGAMCNVHSSCPTVTNCVFKGNIAQYGAAMRNEGYCSPIVNHCISCYGKEAICLPIIHQIFHQEPVAITMMIAG
jgi:hypothetical protein